jgi:hypothetical protein
MIAPSICCETCRISASQGTRGAMDAKCPECCVRHIMRLIKSLGEFGDDQHEGRIKDALFDELLKWRGNEGQASMRSAPCAEAESREPKQGA